MDTSVYCLLPFATTKSEGTVEGRSPKDVLNQVEFPSDAER